MDLGDWAKKHRLYLKLEEGVALTCKFLDAEAFVDKENEDRDKIRYKLEVDGSEKLLESQSIGLAEAMGKVKKGDWIAIMRMGKGRQTRYEVEILENP